MYYKLCCFEVVAFRLLFRSVLVLVVKRFEWSLSFWAAYNLSLTSMYHITISNYRCAFSPCTLIYYYCLAYLTIPSLNLSASTFAGRIAPLPRSTSSSHAASSRQDSVICASCWAYHPIASPWWSMLRWAQPYSHISPLQRKLSYKETQMIILEDSSLLSLMKIYKWLLCGV